MYLNILAQKPLRPLLCNVIDDPVQAIQAVHLYEVRNLVAPLCSRRVWSW